MPQRLEPFLNGNIYHLFNRTIDGRRIFQTDKYSSLFLNILSYYRSNNPELSYSKFKRLHFEQQNIILEGMIKEQDYRIRILAYCLMPTHFHLLIQQIKDKGIPKFIADTINSFTKRYNLENKRKGPIFLSKFKSSSIATDEILMHVSRYIHLNPYSSGLVKSIKDIQLYPWSSLKEYIYNKDNLCKPDLIFGLFGNNPQRYIRFVRDNADYQKKLESVKYLDKW